MEDKKTIVPATLAGRCANGFERGQGVVVHAVECSDNELRFGIDFYAESLCGKTHGARSAGWCSRRDLQVTCRKCLKVLAQANSIKVVPEKAIENSTGKVYKQTDVFEALNTIEDAHNENAPKS